MSQSGCILHLNALYNNSYFLLTCTLCFTYDQALSNNQNKATMCEQMSKVGFEGETLHMAAGTIPMGLPQALCFDSRPK